MPEQHVGWRFVGTLIRPDGSTAETWTCRDPELSWGDDVSVLAVHGTGWERTTDGGGS